MVVGCSFRARAAPEGNNLDIKAKKVVGDSMVARELKCDAGPALVGNAVVQSTYYR